MLTKFEAHRAYRLVVDKMLEYEEVCNISHIDGDTLNYYEHLKSMSEYLVNSLELGATEVLFEPDEMQLLRTDVTQYVKNGI